MIRAIVGVIVGYVVWSGVWIGANAIFFAHAMDEVSLGRRLDDPGTLLAVLLVSIACSLLGGAACGMIAATRWRGAAITLGVALLATGVAVQASVWDQEPLWYHVAFLILLIPLTLAGARLTGKKKLPATS